MKKLIKRFLNWKADADENGVAYNLLHLIFWGIVVGTVIFLLIIFD